MNDMTFCLPYWISRYEYSLPFTFKKAPVTLPEDTKFTKLIENIRKKKAAHVWHIQCI